MSSYFSRYGVQGARAFSYTMLYYPDQTNHCPGCGATSWYLGRISAECARCHTALPLAQSMQQSTAPIFVTGHTGKPSSYGEFAYA